MERGGVTDREPGQKVRVGQVGGHHRRDEQTHLVAPRRPQRLVRQVARRGVGQAERHAQGACEARGCSTG